MPDALPDPLWAHPRQCRRCALIPPVVLDQPAPTACPACGETLPERRCLQCNYSLAGLGDTGDCPECGEPFFDSNLVLAGVPQAAAPGGRRWLWIALIAVGVIHTYTWVLQPFIMAGLIWLAIIGGLIAMVATNRRERSGVERFVISPNGISRLPFKGTRSKRPLLESDQDEHKTADSVFVPWNGSDTVTIKRVGVFWKRLRIGRVSPEGVFKDVVFDAGIRCPDSATQLVQDTVQSMLDTTIPENEAPPPERGH